MAITRKSIRELFPDIEDDTLGKLLNLIHEETDTLKDENKGLKDQLNEANTALETAKAEKTTAENALTAEREKQTKAAERAKKSEVYKAILKKAKVDEKYIDKILKHSGTEIDKIELDEKGNAKDEETITTGITSEWGEYIVKDGRKGADVDNPPKNDPDPAAPTTLAGALAERYSK